MWSPASATSEVPGQVEALVGDLVDLEALGREEAGAVHRLLAHEHRRDDRHEPLRGGAVEGPAVQREGDARGVADDVAEARARQPRGALHLEAPELEVVLRIGELGRLAGGAHDVALGVSALLVRDRLVRRVRDLLQQLVAPRLRRRVLLLEPPQVLLDLLQLLDLLRARLALDLLPAAELVDLRHELAPARVGREQLVECLAAALARDGRPKPSGSARAARRSINPFVR